MNKNQFYKAFSMTIMIIGLTMFRMNSVMGWWGIAENGSGPGTDDQYDLCPDCKYVMNFENVYTTYVATAPDGTQKTYTICNTDVAGTNTVTCDVIDDNFELPLLSNGLTNPNYQPYVDNWLNQTIINGELNETHPAARILAELYCSDYNGGTTIPTSCRTYIKKLVADNDNDLIDSSVYQGAVIRKSGTTERIAVSSYNGNLCSGNYSGVNGVLCNNLAPACLAGTDASYSKSNGKDIIEGSSGVCVWNSWNSIDTTELSCKDQCKAACKKITSQNASTCVKSCMVARAGTDDSCPPLNETCEEQCQRLYSDNEAAISTCIKGKCENTTLTCEQKCEQSYNDSKTIESCKKSSCDPKSECKTSEPYIACSEVNCNYEKAKYENSDTGGGCGTTQNLSIYQVTDNYCDLATIYNHIQVSIKYPSQIDSIIYAGQGFNSNNKFSGTVTETTFVSDIGAISNAIVIEEEKKKALESKMKIDVENAICSAEDQYKDCVSKGSQNCKAVDEGMKETITEGIENGFSEELTKFDKKIKELKECEKSARSYKSTSTSRTISTAHSYMTIGQYTQDAFSIKAIDKSSGLPLTSKTNNSIDETSEFYVPNTVSAGSIGTLSATTTVTYGGTSHQFSSTCPFNVGNEIICPPGGCDDGGSLNLIYRPISLVNPFPNANDTNSNSRETKGFWNDATADIFIKNNREVSNYEVYNLTPMYTITLTPSTIKEIRDYNAGKGNYSGNKHDYSDFNLDCTDGLYCKSEFLRETFNNIIDSSKSCAIGDDWYACDSQKLANTRDSLLDYLR